MHRYAELRDYRRCVAEIYAALRLSSSDEAARCRQFRTARDRLFRSHPQSPIAAAQRAHFSGLRYFAYDPALRFVVPVDTAVELATFTLEMEDDGPLRLHRWGSVHFAIDGQVVALSIFWILGYGGGLFLPFRDLTNSHETFGGGRYLLDTIKHADLGQEGDRLVVDFNYAYNPSCAYDARWHCPLAPMENHLPVAVRAGEQAYLEDNSLPLRDTAAEASDAQWRRLDR